jgi:AraC-like DNA-binding protein
MGDSMEYFRDSDLVMVGPNLPHQWKTDTVVKGKKARQLVIQINSSFLGNDFFEKNEVQTLKELFRKASRGIMYYGKSRKRALNIMNRMKGSGSLHGLIMLLQLLHHFAETDECRILASEGFRNVLENPKTTDKREMVMNYIFGNFRDDISMNDLAAKLNMSISAFAHFIRKKTGKTFTELINDLRIGYACKLLTETNKSVSEVAFECGYNNLSYFNRRFKLNKGTGPKEYRRR